MPERKKYQIFISSTYEDLYRERQAVTWALLKARHIPVGMEAFSATDDRGWKTITATIDDSDYYILVIGGKLGSVDCDTGKSWTRLEYEYARRKGVPVLAFVRAPEAITQDQAESDANRIASLKDFQQLVESNHHRERWTSEADLVSRVTTALTNHIQDDEHEERERPGWYRGDQLPASATTLEELARLSRENSRLRTDLAAAGGARPSLELFYEGRPVLEELTVRHSRISYPGSDSDHRSLASFEVESADLVKGINNTVWLQFSLKNASSVSARSVRVEFTVTPVHDIVVFPHSMVIVPLREKRTNASEHSYVDRYEVMGTTASVVQRVRSINAQATEALIPFGLLGGSKQLDCRVTASDQTGKVLDAEFKIEIKSESDLTQVDDRKELMRLDGKAAPRVDSMQDLLDREK